MDRRNGRAQNKIEEDDELLLALSANPLFSIPFLCLKTQKQSPTTPFLPFFFLRHVSFLTHIPHFPPFSVHFCIIYIHTHKYTYWTFITALEFSTPFNNIILISSSSSNSFDWAKGVFHSAMDHAADAQRTDLMTITRFVLNEQSKYPESRGDFTILLSHIVLGCKFVCSAVNKVFFPSLLSSFCFALFWVFF